MHRALPQAKCVCVAVPHNVGHGAQRASRVRAVLSFHIGLPHARSNGAELVERNSARV